MTTANEYSTTVKKFDRARLKPFLAGDIPAVNYWPVSDNVIGKEFGKDLHELTVTIELHERTRDDPFTDISFNRGADIKTALFRATGAPKVSDVVSFRLGDLVNDITIAAITPMIGEGQAPWCGVIVELLVQYYTSIDDSYTIITI